MCVEDEFLSIKVEFFEEKFRRVVVEAEVKRFDDKFMFLFEL